MRFWDSSAVVPLLVEQASTPAARGWAEEDPDLAIWTLTPVEICSAVYRLVRDGALELEQALRLELAADALAQRAFVVRDVDAARQLSRRLLRVHPLRAADSLQIAAALAWADGTASGRILHTLDARLAAAAEREGFNVPRSV